MKCTYSHGQHTSRADTTHTQHHSGMFDHIIYNRECVRVLELLEIPLEAQLSPSGACPGNLRTAQNHCTQLPNIVYPSQHLRIEAVLQFITKPSEGQTLIC